MENHSVKALRSPLPSCAGESLPAVFLLPDSLPWHPTLHPRTSPATFYLLFINRILSAQVRIHRGFPFRNCRCCRLRKSILRDRIGNVGHFRKLLQRIHSQWKSGTYQPLCLLSVLIITVNPASAITLFICSCSSCGTSLFCTFAPLFSAT